MLIKKTAARLETKRSGLSLKIADLAEDGTFTGYGSVFDVVDTGGDIVRPGAFAKSLVVRKASGDWPRLLFEHDPARPIGVWDEIREDERGLFCKGRLVLEVQDAREAYALMKAGHRFGLSIGYEPFASAYASPDDVEQKLGIRLPERMPYLPTGQLRTLDEVDLWEVSAVTFPMCTEAGIDSVKAVSTGIDARALAALESALDRRAAALAALTRAR